MSTGPGILDENRLFIDEDGDGQGGVYVTRAGQLAVHTLRGPGREGSSEDAAAILQADADTWVLAVADGVGGQPGGRHASALALRELDRAIAEAPRDSDNGSWLRSAIIDGIERANRAVLDLGTGAGTTLAVAEIGPGYVRPYHVGDSAVLLVGQRGRVKLQTTPHSPVGFAVEAGLLEEHEAMHHELLHIISNVIGDPEMRIEIGSELAMAERDTLVVASDGLLDNLFADEIRDLVRVGPLERVVHELRARVSRRMHGESPGCPCKPDDCTVIVFRRHSTVSRRVWQAHDPDTRDWVADAAPGPA